MTKELRNRKSRTGAAIAFRVWAWDFSCNWSLVPGHFALLLQLGILMPSWSSSAAAPTNEVYNVRAGTRTNVVVAADGSGDFRTVQEGVQATATGSSNQPIVVRIKPGK